MVVRLLCTIATLVILAFFVGYNLDNKCDVNLLVHTFKDVHIFITIIISFAAGSLFTLPVIFIHKSKKNKKENESCQKQKKFSFKKNKGLLAKAEVAVEEIKSEDKTISSENSESETGNPV